MGKKHTKQIGKLGEDLAADFLKRDNYNIIQRNYRNKMGEIDIIAQDAGIICFIEVKTRTSDSFGFPHEAISRSKQRKMAQVALGYLKANNNLEGDFRFDSVAVMLNSDGSKPDIDLIKNAFELDRQYYI